MLNKNYYMSMKREKLESSYKNLNNSINKSFDKVFSLNAEINKLKKNGWSKIKESLVKTYKTENFEKTMFLVDSIGSICEKFDHHPDYLTLKYSEVTVSFSTHSAGGITKKDTDIASVIDEIKFKS